MSEKFVVNGGLSIPQGKQLEIGSTPLSGITTGDTLADAEINKAFIPSEYSVKTYVDAQLGSTDMSFAADSNSGALAGDDLKVDLSGGETFSILGTTNEIETDTAVANQIKVGLPSAVTITTSAAIGGLSISAGSITDDTGSIDFGDENLSTTGTLGSGEITSSGAVTAGGNVTAVGSIIIGSADMDESDLEKLDGITNGQAEADKALVVDASKDIASLNNIDGAGDLSMGSITMTGFTVDAAGITEIADGSALASSAAPTTDAMVANKKYVDDQVSASDLDFTVGTDVYALDLDSEGLTIVGTDNEVNLGSSEDGNGNVTLTVGLPAEVVIETKLSAATLSASGAMVIDGGSNMKGNVILGDAATDVLTFNGYAGSSLLPLTDSTYELGGANNKWSKIHVDELHGTADNMLLFSQASDDSATEHSFDVADDGVLALQGADHVRSLSDIKPGSDGALDLGSTSLRWNSLHSDQVEMEHSARKDFSVSPAGSATTVVSFADADYKSAKIVCNISNGTNSTAQEVLVVSHNSTVKIVEYGKVSIGTEVSMTWAVSTDGTNTTVTCDATGALKGSYEKSNASKNKTAKKNHKKQK